MKRIIKVCMCALMAGLMPPAFGGTIVQQNNFDGDNGNDIGPEFTIASINNPENTDLMDASAGVISFSAPAGSRPNVTLVSSSSLDLSGDGGFTVRWNIESIASTAFLLQKNGLFLGVQTDNSTAWNNVVSLGVGIKNDTGAGDLDLVYAVSTNKGFEATLVASGGLTDDSIIDGFTAVLTVNDDNTWRVSTTGLSADVNTTGTLSNVTYSQLAGTLFACTALQLNKSQPVHTITCGSMSVEVPARPATLSLTPSDQLDIELLEPATLAAGTVDVTFSYGPESNNVQVTSATVINQQHAGAYSVVGFSSPLTLTDPASSEALNIKFDVTGTGLTGGETSAGTLEVVWNEIGGDSNTNTLPISALVRAAVGVVWTEGASFIGDDNQNNISLEGIQVKAVNLGGNLGDLDVVVNNGTKSETITFVDDNALFPNSAYNAVSPGTSDANWNSVIFRSDYKGNQSPFPFTLTDLFVGQEYQVEFFVWDTRKPDTATRTFSLDDGKGRSSDTYTQADGVSVIATFTADATTQIFRISQSAGSPNMNAYVLRAIGDAPVAEVQMSAGSGGNVNVSAGQMSAYYTYTLQGTENLVQTNWVDIATTSGVVEVNWTDLVTSNDVQFFRVISE
ncbi:hypothetical protein [Pontiella sulfatireligans]|uniref:Uncharacterized protein n=1 Tax=Pontiella sulfatireligans TaxID=2750658 RepID=A0A6C2UF51_9BACT|nr:hypothetical protein [Pontiella sulfatireligans]VGO18842.1 hypothetical protein SCARR_00895 [Pontiella sulfatireligans]